MARLPRRRTLTIDQLRALEADWEAVAAIRDRLSDALRRADVVIEHAGLFTQHTFYDAKGEPVSATLAYDAEKAAATINAAIGGDLAADAALRMAAADLRKRYPSLPPDLATYMRSTRRKGRRARTLNAAIIWAVDTIHQRFDIPPTPQNASPDVPIRSSACAIVALVLCDLGCREPRTERAVRAIWERRPKPQKERRRKPKK